MLTRQEATPCPEAPSSLTSALRRPRDSLCSVGGDSTANVDFTTEFGASLRNVAPRRRQTGIGLGAKRRTTGVTFSIHEDEEVKTFSKNQQSTRQTSIFAQPPQRFKPRVSFGPGPDSTRRPEDRRFPAATVALSEALPVKSAMRRSIGFGSSADNQRPVGERMKKPARRGTIYIPSEDTTIASVYMGVFSPITKLHPKDLVGGKSEDHSAELTGIAAAMARKRRPRESIAGAPPMRVPLQKPLRPVQETILAHDVYGSRTGKENVPPGTQEAISAKQEEVDLLHITKPLPQNRVSINPVRVRRRSFIPQEERQIPVNSLLASKEPRRSTTRGAVALADPRISTARVVLPRVEDPAPKPKGFEVLSESRPALSINNEQPRKTSDHMIERQDVKVVPIRTNPDRIPHKVMLPQIHGPLPNQQYHLLHEDIAEPSLYEDNWLAHQEAAITQLVNNLFSSSRGSEDDIDPISLRVDLLGMYHDAAGPLLQRRMQAAMLYGALSIPKEFLAKSSRLMDDLATKRAFLDIWTGTYDLTALRAAAEVVFGRDCAGTPRSSWTHQSQRSSADNKGKVSKRSLERFLETFLLRNEDATSDGSTGWAYRRTVLRSLLLVLLLDQSKTLPPKPPLKSCLFTPPSPHKSSRAVLDALAKLLLPFSGDITRSLGHLNYSVNYVQYPLEEYEYDIGNLAVDMRDGIRLTRLVELLLYPSASRALALSPDRDGTTTIAMPTGEMLSLVEGEEDWPLSQHLKFPCLGRATKLYNVQLALSALSNVKSISAVIKDIKAEDIVDGFREKTVALLWALVGKWGLGGLIDWVDLRSETRRLEKRACHDDNESSDFDNEEDLDEGFERYKALLKRWATAVAGQEGLQVNNLTTCFSDGRILNVIVNEYAPFLAGCDGEASQRGLPLDEKLKGLGCSSQFASIFTRQNSHPHGRIFGRDFTIASLAFLCSRLLSASKHPRAAIIIQRNWRILMQWRTLRKRVTAGKVARECMTVVKTRERLLWAKETILKSWRKHNAQVKRKDEGADIWLSL